MKFVKLNSKKKLLVLFLLSFGMILTNLGLPLFNSLFLNNNYGEGNIIDFDDQYILPKTSDSIPSPKGMGNKVNISLHQSYLNNSFNTALSPSDSNNNSFSLPCPKDITFNSTFTNITIQDISAPNKTLIIEDEELAFNELLDKAYYTSFQIPNKCYVENISIRVSTTSSQYLEVRIYNASWDGTYLNYDLPNTVIKQVPNVNHASPLWENITNWHQLLDPSNTDNNTFFVRVRSELDANANWYEGSDGAYDSIVWAHGSATPELGIDMTLKLGLSPINETPSPEQINLKINNKTANGYGDGIDSGYWESVLINSSTSGELHYNVSADWWDVTCSISQVQINYTKTDLKADSSFEVFGNGQDVIWNVTKSDGLDYFDSRFNNYTINFTISSRWTNIEVWNGGTNKTDDIKTTYLNNYKDIQVLNAGNGTFWFLNATSSNLLTNIKKYVVTTPVDTFNYTNLVHFNGTFSSPISDGIINHSIFNPLVLNDQLNHTFTNSSFGSGDEIYFGDWDISDTITNYGKFRTTTLWNNGTDAGYFRDNMTIFAETSLLINQPSQNTFFKSGAIFNITITYIDIGQSQDISVGDVYYKINAGTYSPVNESVEYIDNGQYNITFDANNTEFNYGSNSITIRANNTYYHNQTKRLDIIILGETELDGSIQKLSLDSTETFNVSLFYNDTVKDSGIFGAIRDIYVNSTPYSSISNHDYGDGNYNITINCDDDIFQSQGYGYFNLSINVEKSYYYNQSTEFIIYITGDTSLSTTKYPDPSIGYYNSNQAFNITAFFEDIGRSEGINGGLAKIYVKEESASSYQEYTPVVIDPLGGGYYNITVDCSDPIFNSYGKYDIKINITKSHYYTAEDILGEIVMGNTDLTILDPTGSVFYVEDEIFDIIIEYEDLTLSSGIIGADITYTINGTGYRSDNILDNLDGTYNITIVAGDNDFGNNYNEVDIIIRANKSYYINLTRTFTFERQITTQIAPLNIVDLGSVLKGLNVSYTFNYSDSNGKPIDQANWAPIGASYGFQAFLQNRGDGNYTMHLDSTNVGVLGSPYTLSFNVSYTGNETQIIQMTIDVLIIQTEVINVSSIPEIARNSGLNQSVRFYFNDTTNDLPVLNIITQNIRVKNYWTGTQFINGEFWLTNPSNNGTYFLDISMGTRDSGWYTLEINASRFPNYDISLFNVTFYYRGNYTDINLISLSDTGGLLSPTGLLNFTIFEGDDIDTEFNITDSEYSDSLVIGDADTYTVRYTNLGTGSNGILVANLNFVTLLHTGTILTSNPVLTMGRYLLNITTSRTNYEDAWYAFNLTIIAKHQTNLTRVFVPPQINSGDEFSIIIRATFFNGTDWLPLVSGTIRMTPYFNGIVSTIQTVDTNNTGEIRFYITTGSSLRTVNITLELLVEYNYLGYSDDISALEITVIPPTPPLSFEDLLPYIIMIGAVAVVVVASLATYRGVIVPKKREKQRVLTEVKTIFDDAINLEHILVLYKGTGTCIFFKSYGSEQIDPELIGGFLSAVSSFGKEMATQEALNEISYGDKMLLLADGNLIRVALVLGKNASLILRRHLKEFIGTFEKTYNEVLPNWRGQLNYFKNAGLIVDDLLNTSIILPHQISYDFSSVKDLKNPHSKEVLKVAQSCCEETEREFFFIATLLKDASEMTSKDTAEIFMGIKELRDKKILIPIEISAIEAHPISQQELNLINQKVVALPNLTNDEKQKLVQDLSQLGPIEREAYLTSLSKQNEIVTAPIKTTTVEGVDVDNKKSAKKGVRELMKRGKIADGKKDHVKAIEFYQTAAALASNWELTDDYVRIEEIIRKTKIEDLKEKKSQLEKEAKDAVKAKNYTEAAGKFKYASKMASEIFKLGDTSMTKEVKRLTNKSNEYEKLK